MNILFLFFWIRDCYIRNRNLAHLSCGYNALHITREQIFFCSFFFFLVIQNRASSSFSYRIWEVSPTLIWLSNQQDHYFSVNQNSAWYKSFQCKSDSVPEFTELIGELSEPRANCMKQPYLSWNWWVIFRSWSNWRVMLVLCRQSSNLSEFSQDTI